MATPRYVGAGTPSRTGGGGSTTRLRLWVKPGSSRDSLGWDPWRSCWVVSCQPPAVGGKANRAVLSLLAVWLELPSQAIHWERAGRSREKVVRIDGVCETEVSHRLETYRRRTAP
ncbi:MAG: DUF167 domain-containing protein [Thermoplasmata archaeon]